MQETVKNSYSLTIHGWIGISLLTSRWPHETARGDTIFIHIGDQMAEHQKEVTSPQGQLNESYERQGPQETRASHLRKVGQDADQSERRYHTDCMIGLHGTTHPGVDCTEADKRQASLTSYQAAKALSRRREKSLVSRRDKTRTEGKQDKGQEKEGERISDPASARRASFHRGVAECRISAGFLFLKSLNAWRSGRLRTVSVVDSPCLGASIVKISNDEGSVTRADLMNDV